MYKLFLWTPIIFNALQCSYMDTEQYEEAVRDYEKIFKTDKSRGKNQSKLSFKLNSVSSIT